MNAPASTPEPGRRPRTSILAPVFYPAAILVAVLVALSFVMPRQAEAMFTAAQTWVADEAGWFSILSVAGFLVFVVAVAVSSLGRIRLGPEHSTPDYGYATWFAMLFAAGMGVGLMYFGVAEPVMHYVEPPVGDPAGPRRGDGLLLLSAPGSVRSAQFPARGSAQARGCLQLPRHGPSPRGRAGL